MQNTANIKAVITAEDRASATLKGFGSSVEKISNLARDALIGASTAAFAFGLESVKAFADAQAQIAQINQVLDTTGKISEISSKSVIDLSMAMEKYSGQSHVAIQAGQVLLLQFAQTTNKNLPEMTKAMVDLAQRMGVDDVTAAKSLGIALDDPTTGMNRLRRSGIDFTESQKETIKSLQKTGDITGADAILMQALEEKVGGAGGAFRNTFAGSVAYAKTQIVDLQENIGALITKALEPLLMKIGDFAGQIGPAITNKLETAISAVQGFAKNIQASIANQPWDGVISIMMDKFTSALIQWLPRGIEEAIVGLVAVGPRIISAIIDGILKAAVEHPLDMINMLLVLGFLPEKVVASLISVLGKIPFVGTMAGWLLKGFEAVGNIVTAPFKAMLGAVLGGVQDALQPAYGIGSEILNLIRSGANSIFGPVLGFFRDIGTGLVNGLARGVGGAIGSVIEGFGAVLRSAVSMAYSFVRMFYDAGAALIRAFADGIMSAGSWAYNAAKSVLSFVRKLLPFSDAKEGPLSDLTLSGQRFSETFAKGILAGSDAITTSATAALSGAIPYMNNSSPGVQAPLTSTPSSGTQTVNHITFSGVFTGNEMEFRKLAIKIFQAGGDAAGMQNKDITDMTTQNWRRV